MVTTAEVHFYLMWFSLGGAISCLLTTRGCLIFSPKPVKLATFFLLLSSGYSWANDMLEMNNTTALNSLQEKYHHARLQRDVYLEFIETFSFMLLLLIPYFHEFYKQKINKLKEELHIEKDKYLKLANNK